VRLIARDQISRSVSGSVSRLLDSAQIASQASACAIRFREVDQLHSEFPSSMDAPDQQPCCVAPSVRAMFQMLGVFAEFERSMIRERVMAGLSRAKADGIQLGRRRLEDSDADKVAAIVAARARGSGSAELPGILGWGWERCCG
jgi:hypothetical protein